MIIAIRDKAITATREELWIKRANEYTSIALYLNLDDVLAFFIKIASMKGALI